MRVRQHTEITTADAGTPVASTQRVVDDFEDTDVGIPLPHADTDPRYVLTAVAQADTDEWDDTDRDVEAQGQITVTPAMFEDTGVVIVSRPAEPRRDQFLITFRDPPPVANVNFAECSKIDFPDEPPTEPFEIVPAARGSTPTVRAATAGEWPPAPREPAAKAP